MLSGLRVLLILAIGGVLAACATAPPRLEAAPDKLAAIKTVAVIISPEPREYAVGDFAHPGMLFGLVGAAAGAADQQNKSRQLTAALKQQNFAVADRIAERVTAGLAAAGYAARRETGPWEEKEGGHSIRFENIRSDADAVIVLVPRMVGFLAPSFGSDYLTTVIVIGTMLDRDRKTQLYRGFHATGFEPKAEGWRYYPPKVTYPSFDAIMQSPAATANALNEAADVVAASIAADLKRR